MSMAASCLLNALAWQTRTIFLTRVAVLILLSSLLVGCGTVGAHAPLLSADQTELPEFEHNLVVANIYFSPAGYALKHLVAINIESSNVHVFPFVDNFIMGSKRLDFERIDLGDDEITRNVVFMDLPRGTYQVTVVGVGNEESNSVLFRFDDLDNLSFEISSDSPTYLGELYVVLSENLTPKAYRARRAVGFDAGDADDFGLQKLKNEYPAIKNLDFVFGKIVTD